MVLEDLVKKNRSIRRFHEDVPLDEKTLRGLVDLARCSASGSNQQPLKFTLSWTPERNAKVFSTLAWAGALPDWPGPPEGERPTGYIIILGDTEISKGFGVDHGIAAQSILLGAVDIGFGGCMLAAIRRDDLRDLLNIPAQYEILLAVALGKPKEKVVLETLEPGGDRRYWRDENAVHHVPKRRLDDIIV